MPYIGAQPTTTAFVTDQFSGNGSTTAFTMSVAPANTNSILVAVSGVLQDPTTYSVSGTTLTFSAAPPSGTGNISVRYLGIPASGVTTTAYRTVTEFTATAGQTSFSVPSYTVGYIDVYRNGAKLGTADFTATTGTTVVLANGASSGDLIQTVSFYVSSVLNAIPATAGAVTNSYLLDGSITKAKMGSGSTWAPVGTVVQVVQGSYATETSSSSSTFADTGLSASITPTSSTSKILVLVNHSVNHKSAGSVDNSLSLRIVRGSTTISTFTDYLGYTNSALLLNFSSSFSYLDSPATTSATTYKTQFASTFNSNQVRICQNNTPATITLLEIAA